MMRVFMERTGIRPDVAAGLSLGEYPAMAAAGVMSDEDAIRTVRQRGILMQGEVPVGQGAMSAVLAMDAEKIEEVIAPIEGVQIANYNCPGQIVISGKTEAVAEAGEKLKEAGAKRVLPLKVSGPFHSKMLVGAGEKLGKVLDTVEIHTPEIPYIANVTADYVTDAADVKPLLMKQVSSSVRWEQTIRKMLADGVDTFIEIGPGKTLTGFMRKIDKKREGVQYRETGRYRQSKGRRLDVKWKSSSCDRCQPRHWRQIAISMAKEGAVVIVNYNGSAAKAEDVVKEITEAADRRKPFSAMYRITARRRCS